MERLHAPLPKGRILEIGSGGGKDAAALIAMGYDYLGIDASSALMQIARTRNPNARFLNLAVHELPFTEAFFDGFWASAVLLHIPNDRIDGALQWIAQVVRPNGFGFISMKHGQGEETEPQTGRRFAYYGLQEFERVLERNGFSSIEANLRSGDKGAWLTFICWPPLAA
jgi:SAM-dependent methyltransferase